MPTQSNFKINHKTRSGYYFILYNISTYHHYEKYSDYYLGQDLKKKKLLFRFKIKHYTVDAKNV